ncbi:MULTISPECIES: TIGR03618 family F420-dependent PPOX class oxidoreductase [Streptomyces]|uniref:Pyridoxamine 5'-phosphate oxidase-related protein n=1 Tax=Streptomyces griseus subsp. griseus (strain JCM 4626 / CBS 651.72 / NBRC 13350 / KCC S-0626 / ISP 5235) TaxID=455632 RepID=B1VNP8_STRGG|nr:MULTISPECIES: TIGR03618 family F420-dependent PPOX class oxidoreductase [Streptomyces]MYR10928.1 TIGR03618 family F420-dependent PPOX class oxidoreductase [Streptomyces sp. SID724]MYR47826.1 TIGR03618 family F420-dependent PPOX class oxidoreductase [Streptomyces sp. SID4928]EGE39741.1 putative F420-dependent enzyme [Streptomyces sp. ACT-1]MBW3702696.1 TIGR03618 family F420-dependent PPOX class oxidoreductase [Streptomyces griseus]NEB58035.1 TIGR03618 family F420-dependent PPOX class oxidore
MTAIFDEAVRARLRAANIWYVGTVFADGAPQVSPMWVDLEGEGELTFNTSVGRVKEENLRRDPRVYLSHADAADPFDRVQISGEVARFVEGAEAHERMDRLARKYLGVERFEWTMPGERRVAVIVRPVKVRHIVGVERFRPGGPVPAP